ncbi:CTP synthase [Candidatus Nomurabacteria bacterium RIFCSPHIGHO2_01_FULL_42_15]|uniref:CTP synthase n=1 Tax=Candidatus Nomurabacteria bacterium RIFCSPHIGHO2_01_FULL_42_15 TaxID=1801742 RepID=A0A1F6VGK7_9BACT|nr:MAG: CTP synthase [Candidatus Nomurabacteria bacterium RIFCSPHIGHO2_01_FULL_42_15]OGI92875.1 MAG: CTP synthase [Candidatus Nomurabacteria bacterium RIFCSPLOWO2_01_FULL_41_18]
MTKQTKYIFVVGGVISGVGKGITTSSIGLILQNRGLTVTAIKIDPYINVDAGTMNPTEHGEVFVLTDGDETDQDMGNYERFLELNLTKVNYMTTGRVYQSVINKERNLEYKGKCVQVVPDIPLEVIKRIKEASINAKADVVVIEIGGTVGEYENILFLEAARMMKIENPEDVFFVMVSYLPTPSKIGEMKTKPTQHAVRALNASGIQPDVLLARGETSLDSKRREKLSIFCNMPASRVFSAPDVDSIYDIPLNFEKEKLSDKLCELMDVVCQKPDTTSWDKWKNFADQAHNGKDTLKIAMIGKYFETGDFMLSDSYLSVIEAIKYSCYAQNKKPIFSWLNSVDYEKSPLKLEELKAYDGIVLPGGFGARGVEGNLKVVKFARENKIPYFGLCYGMQMMVIEYARNVLGLKDANTREVNPDSKNMVIDIMESQKDNLKNNLYGGSMRLGAYKAVLSDGTIANESYGKNEISERHRHRYEVNPSFIAELEKAGLVFSGRSPDGNLMEIAELPKSGHPFFLGTQFHPEFLARPLDPHPLFSAFIKACASGDKK